MSGWSNYPGPMDYPTPGKGTGATGEPTRTIDHVLSLITDALRWTTPPVQQVDVIRTDSGQPLALIIVFTDGDRWTVAVTPHRSHGEPTGPAVQQLAEGVTYISHSGGPDPIRGEQ